MRSPPTVAIYGASSKAARYAHRAQRALAEHGYPVLPISPQYQTVLGVATVPNLGALRAQGLRPPLFTLYVQPRIWTSQVAELIALAPRLVISNPGTEDDAGQAALQAAGIPVIVGCTLVMLASGTFQRALDQVGEL